MATQVWSNDGRLLSGSTTPAEDDGIEDRLARAAYTAVNPLSTTTGAGNTGYTLAPGTTVGRPTNFAGDDAAYQRYLTNAPAIQQANLAYNLGDTGRIATYQNTGYDMGSRYAPNTAQQTYQGTSTQQTYAPQVNVNPQTGFTDPYADAQEAARKAQQEALAANLEAIRARGPQLGAQYDDLAKQAYANYMMNQLKLGYNTQGIATGAQDNLALRQNLNFQDIHADINQNRQNALSALETQILQAKANGSADLADLEQKYAMIQADLYKEAQDRAYAQQREMEQRAYEQKMQQDEISREQALAMAKASAPKIVKPPSGDNPTGTPTVAKSYWEASEQVKKSGSLVPLMAYYSSLGHNVDYITSLINAAISDPESQFYGMSVR